MVFFHLSTFLPDPFLPHANKTVNIIIIIIIIDLQATDVTKKCKPKVRRQNRT